MDYAKLASEIVRYVDEAARSYDSSDYGVPRDYGDNEAAEQRREIEKGVAAKLKAAGVEPTASDERAAKLLIAAGVLTSEQWDAAVRFAAAMQK